jgi:hypothetical protein
MLVIAAVLLNKPDWSWTVAVVPELPAKTLVVVFFVVLEKSKMSITPAPNELAALLLVPFVPTNRLALEVKASLVTLEPLPKSL